MASTSASSRVRTCRRTGVVINNPDIERSSRNGIAPVAGEVSIYGGHIYDSGLHAVDFEPNNDEGALSIIGVVDGVDIRTFQGLDVAGLVGYAVGARRVLHKDQAIHDHPEFDGRRAENAIYWTATVIVRNNVSDVQVFADFPEFRQVTFTDNVRITRR